MDPFLEGEMWQEFHGTFANAIRGQLLTHLKPKYIALLAKRFTFGDPVLGIARTIYPDVHIVRQTREAYTVAGAPVELQNLLPVPVPYLAIEIRDVAERRLITVIEILSPENKRGRGFRDYATKRVEILETDTHLIEIDLLRLGQRIELIGELPRASYFVFVSRWTRRPNTQVFPIQLRDQLPTIPVPLLPPDPDAQLDLQAALAACFDLVGYERLLDYSQTLPELSAEDAAWIAETYRKFASQ
jgi:hypothetical protein